MGGNDQQNQTHLETKGFEMDLSKLAQDLKDVMQAAADEKAAMQADVDAKNNTIKDLKTAIAADQSDQAECDAVVAAAQEFLTALAPYMPVDPAPVE